MKAFLEAFTKCFLYILILTLSNVFDRYVLYFTVGEIRVKHLVEKHKSRKWWKQEAGNLTPKPVQLERSCLSPSKGGRRQGAHGKAGFPHREPAKSELPVKLETTPPTFTWLAQSHKKGAADFPMPQMPHSDTGRSQNVKETTLQKLYVYCMKRIHVN